MRTFDPYDEMDTWPLERIERLAWRRLRRVLHLAYDHVPFYRRRFDSVGLRPADIRSQADLIRLPSVKMSELIKLTGRDGGWPLGIEVQEGRQASVFSLGSGGDGIVYNPESWVRARSVSTARAFWISGFRRGMRVMTLAPAWHGGALCERWVFEKLLPANSVAVPWGSFQAHFAGKVLDAIAELKPDKLIVFLPTLYAVLAECRRRRMAPREAFAGVRFLSLVGGAISRRGREQLRETLGVEDVFEGYSNVEGITAPECPEHRGYHLMMDTALVEVVDPDTGEPLPPGCRGSLLVTSLIPHGSVFLRLEVGDLAEIFPDPCPCGRPWPLLKVYDRLVNRFTIAERTLVPYDVRRCLDEVDALVGVPCAIIRSKEEMPRLRLVIERPNNQDLCAITERAAREVRRGLGLEADIEWAEVLPAQWKGTPVIEEEEWRNA